MYNVHPHISENTFKGDDLQSLFLLLIKYFIIINLFHTPLSILGAICWMISEQNHYAVFPFLFDFENCFYYRIRILLFLNGTVF